MRDRVFLCLALTTLAATAAHAQFGDITIGGQARAFAMGGAGIATASGAGRVNPASLAFDKGMMNVYTPSLGVRAGGAMSIDNGRLWEFLTNSDRGDAATRIARSFAGEDSDFGFNTGLGVRFGHLEALATGVAVGRLQPNATLASWANSGAAGNPPAGSRADALAAALYTFPTVGFATTLPEKNDKRRFNVAVGARLKYMTGLYTHYIATTDGNGNFDAGPASELNGGDHLTRSGVGADVGVMLQSRGDGGMLSLGAAIANAIKPSGITFSGTDRNDQAKTYDLLVTSLSVGAAFHKGSTTVVADLVDLTAAAGPRQLRAGAEQKFGPLALRGGYASATGFTWGFGVFGLDVAFGKRQPLEIVRTIRF